MATKLPADIVAIEAGNQQRFLFFVNDDRNIAYYLWKDGTDGQYDFKGIVSETKDDHGANMDPIKIVPSSRTINGTVYANGTQVRWN
jgi:hypothetical protein